MAPDTQSIDCNRTFLTLGLALSRPFENSIDDPEYADSEALSAAIKRVGLDDEDDEDVDEEEDEDDFNEEAEDDEDEDDEEDEYEDDEEDEEEDEEDDDDLDDDEIDEDENDDDIKLI